MVPSDDKKNARLIISHIIVATLKGIKMHYPEVSEERARELQAFRDGLMASHREPSHPPRTSSQKPIPDSLPAPI